MPAELLHSLPQAKEVILCVASGDLGDALDLLHDHGPVPYRVQVIWNHTDLDLLQGLLGRGYQVFDGPVKGPNRLFAGRSQGYYLPGYESVHDAFAVAYRDWWRRVGTFLLISGIVGAVYPEQQLFQLKGREHFFISVASSKLRLPEPRAAVEVVLNCPWASSHLLLAVAERILVRDSASAAP
ncbi:MAG: hypothetical protein KGJ86_01870 [Chloroflexota bacterium]|nr:hypothetical protein [Chloroflexota bacterium]